ncbi:hypothetical protein HMPREF9022_04687, partial [Erysipelotrichaceae bacterium 2_2_44A]
MMSCEKSYLNRIHRTAFLLDTDILILSVEII